MTDQMRGAAEETDVGVRGPWSLNNSITTQPILPDFSLEPGRVDPLRDVVVGDGTVEYNRDLGGYVVDGTQISFETAAQVRYRPGGLSYAGQAVYIPSDPPAGHLDIGLGHVPYHPYTTEQVPFGPSDGEVILRLTSNGDWAFVIRRDDIETILPRKPDAESWQGTRAEGRSWNPKNTPSKGEHIKAEDGDISGRYWGFDKMDGAGPGDGNRSGMDLDQRPLMVLPKIIGTWYGKGPYYLTFETAASNGFQRPYRAVALESERQSISTRATMPLMARYNDDGAGEPFQFSVYGRQGSGAGPVATRPKTPWDWQEDLSYGQGIGNATLLMAYRRTPESSVTEHVNFRGVTYGLQKTSMYTPERSVIFASFDIDFDTQTPDWGTPTSESNQADVSIQTATQDTGGDELTADPFSGTIQEAGHIASGKASGGQAVYDIDPVKQPTARTKVTGVFAFSATNQNVTTADMLTVFSESGT